MLSAIFIVITVLAHVAFSSEFAGGTYAIRQFMNWYVPGSGVWLGHLSYPPDWCRGNGVEALANYYLSNEDRLNQEEKDYIWQVLLDVKRNQDSFFYQKADYFDDILWWSLAYTRAYEIAVKRNDGFAANYFLQNAQSINDVVTKDAWTDDFCAGGVYWSRDFSYKNAITNELYFVSSSRLAYLTKDSRFSDRAQKSLGWILSSGMIDQSDSLFVDGLDDDCHPTGAKYTYNQGVILGGLVEYNRLYPNASLISLGNNIASSVAVHMTDANGILMEPSCGDGALFKGIYTRYLRYFLSLSQTSQSASLNQFLTNQTTSVWKNDRDVRNGYFGKNWAGPYDYNFHNLQIAAVDLFTAGNDVTGSDEDKCGEHGLWVAGQCACFARYSGSTCAEETLWADHYNSQTLSLTSLTVNKLLCVSTDGKVSSCLSDQEQDSTYLTVEKRSNTSSNQIRFKTNWGSYIIVDQSAVKAVTSTDPNSDDRLHFTVDVLTKGEWNHPMQLEAVRLRTTDNKFLVLSNRGASTTTDTSRASPFLSNLKQQCQ